jgi:hypothetical protein
MKRIFRWIVRGGIAMAFGLLLAGFWPLQLKQENLVVLLPLPEPIAAEFSFQRPKNLQVNRLSQISMSIDLVDSVGLGGETNAVLVYRLELDGAQVFPNGSVQIPLAADHHQEVLWNVSLPRPGEYSGTWWVYLEQVAREGHQVEQQALVAKKFTVDGFRFLGMSNKLTRWLGIVGLVAGLLVETGVALISRRSIEIR